MMNKKCYICILTNMQKPMPRQTSDRYHEFIARLLKQPRDMEDLTLYFQVDRRTIYRWIDTIKERLHIEITNTKGKFDLSDASKDLIQNNSLNNWMFNTFSLMNLLDDREALKDRILLEHIPSSNDEDKLQVILEAMEQNRRISFKYTTTTRSTSRNRMSMWSLTASNCLNVDGTLYAKPMRKQTKTTMGCERFRWTR